MINLFQEQSDSNVIQEAGMINSVLKDVADVDIEKIKKDWQDPNNDLKAKLKSTDDEIKHAGDLVDGLEQISNKQRVDTSSIIARARNSVCQFPIYIDQTVPVNAGHTIGKLFERVYATLIQAALAQNPFITEEEANNLVFLKKFHSNIKEAADILINNYYEPIDDIDAMLHESVFYSQKLTDNCIVEFRRVDTTDNILIQENARLINEPLSGFFYLQEADQRTDTKKVVSDKVELNTKDFEELVFSYKDSKGRLVLSKENRDGYKNINDSKYNNDDRRRIMKEFTKVKLLVQQDIKNGKMNNYEYVNGKYMRKKIEQVATTVSTSPSQKETPAVDAPKLLRDSDIKKMNGMLPYTIEATFRIKGSNGVSRDVKYIVGVKTVMHLIRTQDLADDLRELISGDIKKLRKVRYTTGEISFKDYIFNIKGIKADAAKHINYEKRWINTLKRLAEYNKTNGSFLKKPIQAITGGNVPIPNATLILTQPAVTTLTNQTGIDLSVVSNAKKLARTLFLIAVVIVDSSAGTMRVLFTDSDNDWDVQSLASIDAELSKTDNSQILKELNKLVNR